MPNHPWRIALLALALAALACKDKPGPPPKRTHEPAAEASAEPARPQGSDAPAASKPAESPGIGDEGHGDSEPEPR